MENTQLASAEEGAPFESQCQSHVDSLFRPEGEFVPSGSTVNSAYYKGVLERLRNDVRRKSPQKLANGFVLHHDNAPCNTSFLIRQFLSDKKITVRLHLPYSTDLAPCDFWLFPKLKLTVEGKRFASIPEIEAATTKRLKVLMKDDLQNCFKKWQERWNKCVASQGDYFEGD
jgi:hypothetical protein